MKPSNQVTSPEPPMEIKDLRGPRPDFFISADKGQLLRHAGWTSSFPPGRQPWFVWNMQVFSLRHSPPAGKHGELLSLATFALN